MTDEDLLETDDGVQEINEVKKKKALPSDVDHVFVSKNLRDHWGKFGLAHCKKKNRDRVIIVDGSEGVGKSLWTIQQAYTIEPSMFETPEKMLSRIVFTPEDFLDTVKKVKNGVVIFDEAFRGMSSRASLSKTNKKLIQALMEMRMRNNIVFIVLPSFFLLDIYPAMLRSNALFNIYYSKTNGKSLRAFRGYNKAQKNKIYQAGVKKGWIYSDTRFRGLFYNKFPRGKAFEEAYLNKKEEAFAGIDSNKRERSVSEEVYNLALLDRDIAWFSMYTNCGGSLAKTLKVLRLSERPIATSTLKNAVERIEKYYPEKGKEELKKMIKEKKYPPIYDLIFKTHKDDPDNPYTHPKKEETDEEDVEEPSKDTENTE